MKVIIAGSRDITGIDVVEFAIARSGFEITQVISGACRGVDKLGEQWAKENNIPIDLCPADWAKDPKRAGYLRNEVMGSKADALIAIWDGKSPGTKNMISIAKRNGLKVYVYMYEPDRQDTPISDLLT